MAKMKSENPAAEAVTDNEAVVSQEGAALTDSDAKAAANPDDACIAANPDEELVDLFVDRDPSDENQNLLISVNGKNFLMPRGEVSRVPKYIRDEYERSKRAQYKADKTIADRKGIKQSN